MAASSPAIEAGSFWNFMELLIGTEGTARGSRLWLQGGCEGGREVVMTVAARVASTVAVREL